MNTYNVSGELWDKLHNYRNIFVPNGAISMELFFKQFIPNLQFIYLLSDNKDTFGHIIGNDKDYNWLLLQL